MSVTVQAYKVPITTTLPWFEQPLTIGAANFNLEFQFNSREQRWYMDILDASSNPLLLGIRLDIDRDLTGQFQTYIQSDLLFLCKDNSGANQPPTLASFTIDHTLYCLQVAT